MSAHLENKYQPVWTWLTAHPIGVSYIFHDPTFIQVIRI